MIPDLTSDPLSALFSLRGRTAVVTGGAKGIGSAVCTRLAELGANVVVGDLDTTEAEKLAAELARLHSVKTAAVSLDVRRADSVERLADEALALDGAIHVWVNNAGIFPFGNITDTSEEEWDDVMDINAKGVFFGIKAAAARMRQAKAEGPSKVIINMSSISGFRGQAGRAHYTASKHAVLGLTKSAARELGPDGIRVLAIAPTMVKTPGLDTFNVSGGAGEKQAIEQRLLARLPLGRICNPDDVARVVAFCATDLASMMTGSALLVDGGYGAS